MFYRCFISSLLAVSIAISIAISIVPVFAENSHETTSYSDIIEPTAVPTEETLSDENHGEIVSGIGDLFTSYVTPIPVVKSIVNERTDVIYQEHIYSIDWFNSEMMEELILNILTDCSEAIEFIKEYYYGISDICADPDVILSEYYTNDELENIIFSSPQKATETIKMLLSLFLYDNEIPDFLKHDITDIIKKRLYNTRCTFCIF